MSLDRLFMAVFITCTVFAGTLVGQYQQYPNGPGDSGQYVILNAQYGTARRHVDVTPRLRELARQDSIVRMGNSTFCVDQDTGQVKTLRI